MNKQRAYDFALRYQVNSRFGLSASIPIIDASWALPSPLAPTPGPRVPQNGQGFGDLTVGGRYWLLEPGSHFRGNIAVGAGVKMPTGKADVVGFYPTLAGAWSEKAIDQSVQPGDGGWGLVMDVQSYLKIRKGIVFGSVSYLANPGISFYVPVGLYRMRQPDPYTGARGDATFPDYVFLGNYSIRFGGPKRPSTPVRPTAPAPPITQ